MSKVAAAVAGITAVVLGAGCESGIESRVGSSVVAVSSVKSDTWYAAEFVQTMVGMELSSAEDPAAEVSAAVALAEDDCHLFASDDLSSTHSPRQNATGLDDLVRDLHTRYPATDAQIRQGLILQAEYACPDYLDMLTAYDTWAATR
ncbi:hypothetical protein ACFYVR_18775 [Rhodococcus sp. NPDC003318]|uniref:hypothetical protein n=1 Tax=Rhodococcus sp. NPDC003318 TaxID=3364503 RepID=UPI0036BD3232